MATKELVTGSEAAPKKGRGPGRPFLPGQSGNPAGKPKTARNRLQTRFLYELADSFDREGKSAIQRLVEEDPGKYIQCIVALMPKEVEITRPLEDITDGQLDAALSAVHAILAAKGSAAVAAGEDPGSREEAKTKLQPTP